MQSSMLKAIIEDFGNGGTIDGDLVITGDLQVDGGGSLSFDEIIEGTQVIDVTNTEALLVRKNGDGGDVFTVDTTNEKVGISTTSLNEKLSIAPDTDVSAEIGRAHVGYIGYSDMAGFSHVDLNATGTFSLAQNNAGKTIMNAASGQPIAFKIGNADKMIINSSGNVGIGTETPDTLLHIESTSASKPVLKIENVQGGANPVSIQMLRNTSSPADDDFIGQIDFRSMNDAGTPEEILYSYISSQSTDISDGTEDGEMNFYTMKAGTLTNTMTMQSGNVGIGEDDPLSVLVVRGANSVNPGNGNGGNHTIQVIDTTSIAQGVGGGIAFGGNFVGSTETLFAEIRGIKENGTSHDFDSALTFSTRIEDGDITERARISSDGKFGVNDNSPAKIFTVKATGNDDGIAVKASNGQYVALIHQQDTDAGMLRLYDASSTTKIAFNADDGESSYFNNGGKLGIGTTAPQKLLSLAQDGADGAQTAYLQILDADDDTSASTIGEILWSKYHSGTSIADMGSVGVGVTEWGNSSGNRHTYMNFMTVLDGNRTERMRLTDAGKLGIGDTSPTGYVHISPPSGSAPTMYFEQYTSATDGTLGEISFGNRAVDGQLATISAINDGANDSAYLAFSTEVTSGALAERMRIDSTGDVIIKTDGAKIKADSTNTLNLQAHHLKILGSGGEERFHFQSEGNSNPSVFFMKNDAEDTMVQLNTNGDSYIHGKANSAVNFILTAFSTNAGKIPRLALRHSNSNTMGTNTAVDADDVLGEVSFQGYDASSEYIPGATIQAIAGATFTSSEARSDMVFSTASGSATPVERLRLGHDGVLYVGGWSGLAAPTLAIKSNTTGNGLVNVVSLRDSGNTERAYWGFGSSGHSNINHYNGLGSHNFYASGNLRMIIDDNSRVSLSNNDANTSNTVFGKSAFNDGGSDVGADYNVAVGELAMGTGTIAAAQSNTAIGYRALTDITGDGGGGDDNVAIGYDSATSITTGRSNVAIGMNSLKTSTNADNCVVIGTKACENGNVATAADNTIAIGYMSLNDLTSGAKNTALGYKTMSELQQGSSNVAIGYQAMADINHSSASYNIAIGEAALKGANAEQSGCVAIGHGAVNNTSAEADGVVAIGYTAMQGDLTSGADNSIGIGNAALQALTSGAANVAIGYQALDGITSSANNTAVGYQALTACGDSYSNVAVGKNAGDSITNSGGLNTVIGTSADVSAGAAESQIAIGNGAVATQNHETVIAQPIWKTVAKQVTCNKGGDDANDPAHTAAICKIPQYAVITKACALVTTLSNQGNHTLKLCLSTDSSGTDGTVLNNVQDLISTSVECWSGRAADGTNNGIAVGSGDTNKVGYAASALGTDTALSTLDTTGADLYVYLAHNDNNYSGSDTDPTTAPVVQVLIEYVGQD